MGREAWQSEPLLFVGHSSDVEVVVWRRCIASFYLPLTTKTIIHVGSYYWTFCNNSRKPSQMIVLVVDGRVELLKFMQLPRFFTSRTEGPTLLHHPRQTPPSPGSLLASFWDCQSAFSNRQHAGAHGAQRQSSARHSKQHATRVAVNYATALRTSTAISL